MPVGGEALVVGGYTVTWNGVALGLFEGEAGMPSIIYTPHSKPVNRTTLYGNSKIDSIDLGFDLVFEAVLMEYSKGKAPLWPWATWGRHGVKGVLKYTLAQALVLTAIAGTTAANAPATLTASKAILADGHQAKLLYGPDLRTVPLKMDLLPYDSGGNVINFSET